MSQIDSLDNTGILLTKGELDEVTGSAVSANGTTYFAAELDEVTISPVSGGVAKRVHANGLIQVANYFDDYTLSAFVTSGLVSRLDALNYSGSGSTLPDTSGYGHDGTIAGDTEYVASSPTYFNFPLYSYIQMGTILNRSAYTKCVAFYIDSYGTANNLLSGRDGDGHAFWLSGGDKLNAGHNGDYGGSWNTVVGATTINLYQWYFGCVTFNSTTGWKLYLNGVEDGSSNDTLTFYGDDPGDCDLGAYYDSNWLYGRIGLGLVYNRALDAGEISTLFNSIRGRFGI